MSRASRPARGLVGAAGLVLALAAGPAAAEPTPLTDVEMAQTRGGIVAPQLGIDIGFAANMRTFVDGRMVLETQMRWTSGGVVTNQLGDLAGVTAMGAPVTIPALGLAGGSTQILQDFSASRIASVVLNSASDRNIRQDIDITLTIPQLTSLQDRARAAQMSAALQSAVQLGLQSSARGH